MKHYQKLLLTLLNENGWELTESSIDTEWWSAEQWRVSSIKESWGSELLINFLVDPQFEGTTKHSAVRAVSASARPPMDRIEAETGVALMDLMKGKFDPKLVQFVNALNTYRQCHANDV